MGLSPPKPRAPVHHRRITAGGYGREDGLFDIEGHLVDTKAYPFDNAWRGPIPPGEPLHDMWLRLTVDDELTVIEAQAETAAGPYPVCPAITPAFSRLEGLRIGPGWRRAVQSRLGGVQGCTHLAELLGPLATTAFQTVYPCGRGARPARRTSGRRRISGAATRSPATARSCGSTTRAGTPASRRGRSPTEAGFSAGAIAPLPASGR
jgi:hypothetical protein